MNNDVKLKSGFIDNVIENLQMPDIFAVSPKIYGNPGNELQYSALFPRVEKWWFHLEVPSEDINIPIPTILAHGGASGYNRELFISTGGFDELFLPGYNEDLDLSYRAIKMGYKIMYVPSAVAYHKKGETMNKYFESRRLFRIMLRNHFLFMWKNITDKRFSAMHFLTLPFRLVINLMRGNTNVVASFFLALRYTSEVYRKRKEIKKKAKYSDREILDSYRLPKINNL
jgi:GT2 family glycosyltransferase